MATLIATPGAANANSYLTEVEQTAYIETRLHAEAWDSVADPVVALIMATRVMDMMAQPYKYYVPAGNAFDQRAHYRTRPQWTGSPATTTQRLSWPRIGMYDRNGNLIAPTVIPQDLKEGTGELAFQLGTTDRTLDSDISVQGITSIKAGSVALTFKDMVTAKVLPDAVLNMLPPSWFTSELIEYVTGARFSVV